MAFSELPAGEYIADHFVMQLSCVDDRITIDLPDRLMGDVRTSCVEGIGASRAGSTGRRSGVPNITE